MGVPAFYRWLSEKYPKIIQDILEERVPNQPNSNIPLLPIDITKPNPSGVECDNLYIDMNGIIHPCSHPEQGPQPTTEEEMYENVCHYVDRLVRVMRPRRLLYLAIDGVAPRAKMNQQRARRFRSAQEARELHELENHVRDELVKAGKSVPPNKKTWDSNVITPGTPFMLRLAEYIRFYIRKRLSSDKGWKNLKVIFSDASLPGEGEHKIMSHIRLQRAQAGYDPNTVHVLHGLDADLIMLALATHEAHFYISRELVLFGRKSQEQHEQRQMENGFLDAQKALDDKVGPEAMSMLINQQKPLQRVSIPILREYLAVEFASVLRRGVIPFGPSLEKLIDDFVFLCFFVGNDFLPHLPSLDIRDGALDYLLNVYKRLLPSMGGYITNSGGNVNLSNVDVILAEVGAIEDYVFGMKHENEQREQERRRENQQAKRRGDAPPTVVPASTHKVRGRAARILERNKDQEVALSRGHKAKEGARMEKKAKHMMAQDNSRVAEKLKESLGGESGKKQTADIAKLREQQRVKTKTRVKSESIDDSETEADVAKVKTDEPADELKVEAVEMEVVDVAETQRPKRRKGDPSVVGDIEDEFDADDADNDDKPDAARLEDMIDTSDPEVAKSFKEKVKKEQQQKLDEYAKKVVDNVRLHEAGWKDRYYSDKCKADDINENGGREHLFRSYVMGLCWVMKYYYDGCPSWKWYFPYHYAPFASDLKNIERFERDCRSFELSTPFNPVEQLMAVLPSDSKHAIPKAARWLMTDPESPVIDFYPIDVPVDPNGKAMPWLWVVLLPFIDEERLLGAMSSTMAKWTKEELLCNARGLDDGYLYIHKAHPLARKLGTVLQEGKTANSPKVRLTDSAAYGCAGFSGSVRPPLSNELYTVDSNLTIEPPGTAGRITRNSDDCIFSDPIEPNEAVCVCFSEPPKFSHKSVILPGAKFLKAALTDDDKRLRRPRLNRGGGTIANLGMGNGRSQQSGYGSMNIGSYERELAQRTGRGHQMNQVGTRAWGAMEPTPKRPRNGPPPPPPQRQVQNPFSRNASSVPLWQQQRPQNSHTHFDQQNTSRPQNNHIRFDQQNGSSSQAPHGQQQGGRPYGNNYQHQQYQSQPRASYGQQQQQRQQQHYRQPYQANHGHQQQGRPGQLGYQNQRAPIRQQGSQQGFSFRGFSSGQQPNPQRTGGFRPRPAGSDVMNSLRNQLANTLKQNRNSNRNQGGR